MKPSSFTVIMTFCILMILGIAAMPLLDVGVEPTPRQGKTITIKYLWPNTSAKVVEQNLTSPVEGMVSALKGVEAVSSTSYMGRSEIKVQLKEDAKVSSVRFEITSLLRQSYGRLPQGISYPEVSGGEVVYMNSTRNNQQLLLTYLVNADMHTSQIYEYVEQNVRRPLEALEGVSKVEVNGTTDQYVDVNYDPMLLDSYGVTTGDLVDGIKKYLGQDEILGTIRHEKSDGVTEKIMLHLSAEAVGKNLGEMPLKRVNEKIIYLNDLAKVDIKEKEPESYYRVNGLNTIYVNVYIPVDGKVVAMSDKVQDLVEHIKGKWHQKVFLTLSYDKADKQREEMSSLIWRTLLSLLILLGLVWIVKRDLKYLLTISVTLLANLLVAVIMFYAFRLKLHVYSLAGVTVSLGLIIDSTIVMVDHYGYYRNRKAFWSIFAAMFTTIGSMVVVFFLPSELQKDLYDFAWIIIVNLGVSLLVAYYFVPAIMEKWNYSTRKRMVSHGKLKVRWNRFYLRYLTFTSRHKWVYVCLMVLAFGFPFNALPDDKLEENGLSLLSDYKGVLAKYLGGTSQLFADYLEENKYKGKDKEEKILYVNGQMPIGGTASQINQKVILVEEFLKKYPEIAVFTTRIDGRGSKIEIHFKEEAEKSSFPYVLENELIGKLVTIGGAEWSTYGISERGFSNALNLQHRSERLVLTGYNYTQLYRLAEDLCRNLQQNKRVQDIMIETPGHEDQEDESYMVYYKENMELYQVSSPAVYQKLQSYLMPSYVGTFRDRNNASEVYLTPTTTRTFDLWHLENEQLTIDSSQVFVHEMMAVKWRKAKNVIPKEKQEYVLNVAFNVLGSYMYTHDYLDAVQEQFSKNLPVGFKCKSMTYRNPVMDSANYWLLLLVVVVVFFICAIHFESLRYAVVIISVVPVAMIGTFLTFCLTQADFGSGGFASLVMLVGIVVNSGIYILSQYRHVTAVSRKGELRNYICAYNHKIVPIYLTVLSTMMGMIPFFFDGNQEPFWFSFATGVVGGLLISLPALVFVMPIFLHFKIK